MVVGCRINDRKAFFLNLIFLFLIILQPGLSVNGREKGGINC